MTCYDLRFPELARAHAIAGADVLVVSAAWARGADKVDHWTTLCKARALENQCFVVGANIVSQDKLVRLAHDKQGEYSGDSVIHNAYGHIIAQCTPGKAETAAVELDMDELQRFREKFPVLRDRD